MKYRRFLKFLPVLLLALSACSRDPKVRAKRYVDNGNKFFNKGTAAAYKDASIMYRRALKEDRRNAEAWYRLALTDFKLSNYSDAFTALVNTVDLQPANADAKSKLADLYVVAGVQNPNKEQQAKAFEGAKDIADKLVQQDPNSFDGHRILGHIALLKQDMGTAITELKAANTSKPLAPQVVMPYVQALAASNRFPEGEALAYQMIEKDKTYGNIYDILYAEYVRMHRME